MRLHPCVTMIPDITVRWLGKTITYDVRRHDWKVSYLCCWKKATGGAADSGTFGVGYYRKYKYFASQKYGVDHITATHHTGNVLHASTKGNHDVRYHSAHDNKYLKYFKGHEQK